MSISSLLLAKKPATMRPNKPPSPNIHAFFLLPFLPFLSVWSRSAVTTRRFDGRVLSGAGDDSRESSEGVWFPALPKRRLKKDM
jgi:hypothetical protein